MSEIGSPTCAVTRPPKYLIWSGAAQVSAAQTIRRSTRLLFFFVAARKLGPQTFGLYAFLLALFETLALVSGEGFTEYLMRELSKTPASAGGLYSRVCLLRCFYIAVLFAPAIGFLQLLGHRKPTLEVAFWLFLALFPRVLLGVGQGVIGAARRFRSLLWLEAIQGTGLLGVGMFLLISPTLRTVIWAEVVSISAAALGSILLVRRLLRGNWGVAPSWRRILRETAPFNLYPLIVNIYDRIDVVLLSAFAGNFAAGIYAVPYRALGALQIVPFGLKTSILPSISGNAAGGREGDKQLCSRMLSVMYLLALFPVLGITLLASPLILLLFGKDYFPSVLVLRILIWAVIPMFLNYGLNIFLLARSRERVFVWTSLICTAINVSANVVLIPHYSYYAAAAVTILTETVLLAQNCLIIHRSFGFFALPEKFWKTSIMFLLLIAGGLAGNTYAPSVLSTMVAFFILATYLYLNGHLHSIRDWTRHGAFTG